MNCRKCSASLPEGAKYCHICGVKQEVSTRVKSRGNGQGGAIKRGSTWTAIWTEELYVEDGKFRQRRRWKGGFKTKKEALAYAAAPKLEEKERPTLRRYWQAWSRTELPKLSTSKQTALSIAWGKLDELAGKPIEDLTIENLQRCLDRKAPTHYPAKDMKTVLSHLYKRAVAEGNARTNLADFLTLPKLEEKEMEPFTPEELTKLWTAYGAGERIAGFVLLMVYTGMMPGELLAFKADMVDWEHQQIVGCGLKTKKRKETPIVFPDMLAPVIEDLIQTSTSRSNKGYVVGLQKDTFYKRYYAALEGAGVRKLPPYSCRHTTATALALGNIAPSVIQEVMRHTKFATTQRYIHPDTTSALAAVNQLASQTQAPDSNC